MSQGPTQAPPAPAPPPPPGGAAVSTLPPALAAALARLRRLEGLAEIEQEIRSALTPRELAFLLVNRTKAVLPYGVAAVWRPGRGVPLAVSGVAAPDPLAPLVVWLKQITKPLRTAPPSGPALLTLPPWDADETAGEADAAGSGSEKADGQPAIRTPRPPAFVLACPLRRDDESQGLVVFVRPAPWSGDDQAIAARLADVGAHAFWALNRRPHRGSGRPAWRRTMALAALVAGLALLALPVPLSVVAPAAVEPINPIVVGAPLDGVVTEILVQPNQSVEAGAPLFRLDDTLARNRVAVAQGALDIAEADRLTLQQQAFGNVSGSAAAQLAETQVRVRRAELAYAREMLARTAVTAPAAGVVLFTDPNDWRGRPVALGARIMTIADPTDVRLAIALPVDDAFALAPGTEVAFHLNIAPLETRRAEVTEVGYQPRLGEDGVLAYPLKARFMDGIPPPRVGLRGTARLYGEPRPVIYHLLRRPLAALRRLLRV